MGGFVFVEGPGKHEINPLNYLPNTCVVFEVFHTLSIFLEPQFVGDTNLFSGEMDNREYPQRVYQVGQVGFWDGGYVAQHHWIECRRKTYGVFAVSADATVGMAIYPESFEITDGETPDPQTAINEGTIFSKTGGIAWFWDAAEVLISAGAGDIGATLQQLEDLQEEYQNSRQIAMTKPYKYGWMPCCDTITVELVAKGCTIELAINELIW